MMCPWCDTERAMVREPVDPNQNDDIRVYYCAVHGAIKVERLD